jgi:SAM-dependent methyltransferase
LQEHGPRLRCLLSDVQALPLADAALDVVTINAALHHLPAPEAALAEIHRVLRPGGLFALGFEPNQGHFQSPLLRHLAHGLDRACWYASLHQNRRRLRQWLAPTRAARPAPWLAPLNAALLNEGLIDAPLTDRRVFELVDPHACGASTVAGFDPPALIQRYFPGYEVQLLKYTDYLGESARRLPLARAAADRLLGAMAAGRGSLFSWLLRKPIVAPTGDVTDICPWEAT